MSEQPQEVYIENKLDYGKFVLDPTIREKYKEITKDFALSNLKDKELKIVNLRQEILNIIVLTPECFKKSFESFERDQNTTIQFARSRGGFQAKLERSNLYADTSDTKNFEREKSKTIFGGRK